MCPNLVSCSRPLLQPSCAKLCSLIRQDPVVLEHEEGHKPLGSSWIQPPFSHFFPWFLLRFPSAGPRAKEIYDEVGTMEVQLAQLLKMVQVVARIQQSCGIMAKKKDNLQQSDAEVNQFDPFCSFINYWNIIFNTIFMCLCNKVWSYNYQ